MSAKKIVGRYWVIYWPASATNTAKDEYYSGIRAECSCCIETASERRHAVQFATKKRARRHRKELADVPYHSPGGRLRRITVRS